MLGKVLLAVAAVAATLVVVGLLNCGSPQSRQKRWTHLKDDPWGQDSGEGKQPQLKNKWFSYIHKLAASYKKTDCYVCSVMPISSDQVTLYGKVMSKLQAKCFATMAGSGYQQARIIIDDYNPYAPGVKNGRCEAEFWVNWNHTVRGKAIPQQLIMRGKEQHPMCYEQETGTIPMGRTTNCNQILVNGEGAPVYLGSTSNGTWMVQGGWWLCGGNAYLTLPAGWTGVCAPVSVSDHTVFLNLEAKPVARGRRKRAFAQILPHDSVWGTNVPDQFKHWSTGSKVALALFPWVGVAKNILRIETVDYRLGMFMNSSIIIDEAQNKEIDAMRTMVMQNRMALDLLTAASGGTCVLLNTTCCTYITDDVHSDNMTFAMDRLRALQKAMAADHVDVSQSNWFGWLWSGSWMQLLIKAGVLMTCIFILMCCLMACIIPCIKAMVGRMVGNTFVQYVMLQQNELIGEKDYIL